MSNKDKKEKDKFALDISSLRRSKRLNKDVIIFAINYLSYTLVYLSLLTCYFFYNFLDAGRWYE